MIMNLYRHIDRSRIQFDFLYFTNTRGHFDDEIEGLGGTIYRLPPPSNPIARLLDTLRFFQGKQFQAVHVHTLFDGGIYLLAAKLSGVHNRIAHAHSTRGNMTLSNLGSLYQSLSRALTRVFANNLVACGWEAGRYLFGSKPFTVLPNGIDLTRFTDLSNQSGVNLRKALSIPEGCRLICQIGRLDHQKNPGFTLTVAEELEHRKVNFRLIFVGDGKLSSALKASTDHGSLNNKVLFLGNRDDVASVMKASDLLIMPSYYEGFPLVLVESQLMGLPALVSDKITADVDLGLNLVHFLAIDSPAQWAQKVIDTQPQDGYPLPERVAILRDAGYDAGENAKMITALYGVV